MRSSVGVALAGGLLLAGSAGASDITFYENDGFNGRRFTATSSVSDFAGFGFNDRASSVRVEGGYWIFCSDADFQGECRTFGPGDYATLPWELNNRISSGRRISGNYPYSGNPNWNTR